jgi:hypothetical protein
MQQQQQATISSIPHVHIESHFRLKIDFELIACMQLEMKTTKATTTTTSYNITRNSNKNQITARNAFLQKTREEKKRSQVF